MTQDRVSLDRSTESLKEEVNAIGVEISVLRVVLHDLEAKQDDLLRKLYNAAQATPKPDLRQILKTSRSAPLRVAVRRELTIERAAHRDPKMVNILSQLIYDEEAQ